MNNNRHPAATARRAYSRPYVSPLKVHIDRDDDWGVNYVLGGGYDVPDLEFDHAPTILDIGANVGCATKWFKARYPSSTVHAYEPHTLNVAAFIVNTWGLSNVDITGAGVVAGPVKPGEQRRLHEGISGLHSCGFYEADGERGMGKSAYRMANVVDARKLPPCDILKIDTEGSEVEILKCYKHTDGCAAIMLEWHSQSDRAWIEKFLEHNGYQILSDKPTCTIRGDMIAVRRPSANGRRRKT